MIQKRTHGQKYTSKRENSLTLCAETKNLFHATKSIGYQQNVGWFVSRWRLTKLERVIDRKSMTLTLSVFFVVAYAFCSNTQLRDTESVSFESNILTLWI